MQTSMPIPRWTQWLKTISEEGKLSEILKEIKEADSKEASFFLSGVIKLSKSLGPFRGDSFMLDKHCRMPDGCTDIRDEDHDLNEIYHVFLGGFHCFLVEVLTHTVSMLPADKSICLLENFWDYFFNKRRGCTSCAKRVLMLMPGDMRSDFLLNRVMKRKEAYSGSEQHSPACMELSLWLVLIAPVSESIQTELVHLIAGYSNNNARYLRTYSHQRSVRKCLTERLAS